MASRYVTVDSRHWLGMLARAFLSVQTASSRRWARKHYAPDLIIRIILAGLDSLLDSVGNAAW